MTNRNFFLKLSHPSTLLLNNKDEVHYLLTSDTVLSGRYLGMIRKKVLSPFSWQCSIFKMEAACPSETSVNIYQIAWRHIP
jgi:hypothetical protein